MRCASASDSSSDDSERAQTFDVRSAHSQLLAQYFLRVFAERRRRALERELRRREPQRIAYARHLAEGRVRNVDAQTALDHLRLREGLCDVVDRTARHAAL